MQIQNAQMFDWFICLHFLFLYCPLGHMKINVMFSGATLLEGARGQGMEV